MISRVVHTGQREMLHWWWYCSMYSTLVWLGTMQREDNPHRFFTPRRPQSRP